MSHRLSHRVLPIVSFVALASCGGNDSSSAGPGDELGGPSESTPNPNGPVEPGNCSETPLFPAQPYGSNGDDLIRHVVPDSATGDLYFSILLDMYVLRSGASEPELLGTRPNDHIGGMFWLADDRILFPSGSLVPLIEGTVAVVHSTDRSLEDPRVAVALPTPESYNYDYQATDVFVQGDDVVWLGLDKYTDNPAAIPVQWETTSVVRRTSWKNPAEPEALYSTNRFVRDMTLAGGLAFLDEQVNDEEPPDFEQFIVDLESGAVDARTTEEKFGGEVVGGDGESLFVARLDLDDIENIGLFRVTPDGADSERLTTNPFIDLIEKRGDVWVFVDLQGPNDPILVNEYEVGQGVTQIGCIDGVGTTAHALSMQGTVPLVAIFRDFQSTILSFGN